MKNTTTFEIKNKMETEGTVDSLPENHTLKVVCTLGDKEWVGRCKTMTVADLKKMGRGHFPVTRDGRFCPIWFSAFYEILAYGGGIVPSPSNLEKFV